MENYLLPLITLLSGAFGAGLFKIGESYYKTKDKRVDVEVKEMEVDAQEKERLWTRIGSLEGKLEKIEIEQKETLEKYMRLFEEHAKLKALHEHTVHMLEATTTALRETKELLERTTSDLELTRIQIDSLQAKMNL